MVSILNKRSCCWVLQLRPRSDFGRLVLARSKLLWVVDVEVLARCRIGRDEFFTSDNDQGVTASSISVWWTFSSFAPRRDF
jgi:hypothetical protein